MPPPWRVQKDVAGFNDSGVTRADAPERFILIEDGVRIGHRAGLVQSAAV